MSEVKRDGLGEYVESPKVLSDEAMVRARRMIEYATRTRPGCSSPYIDIAVIAGVIEQAHREGVEAGLRGVELAVALAEDAARAAAIAAMRQIIFEVRDRPGRSLDWCNACTVIQDRISTLAKPLEIKRDDDVTYGVVR